MKRSAPYLSDHLLDRHLQTVIASENTATAVVLDHIAEYDARKLFRAAGYASMFKYLVGELHRSEEAAYKRIRAARAARRFPVIFDAIAEGRLHLTAVVMLAPHLTEETAAELIATATHMTGAEIEQLLAQRYPKPDLPARIQPILPPTPATPLELGPESAARLSSRSVGEAQSDSVELALRPVPAPAVVDDLPIVKPLAPQRFALQCTIDQETHAALRYAQELLGHELPSGDVAQVIALALQALIPELEKRRFSATTRPRPGPGRPSENPRHVPAHVQREVWARDRGQCTFVGENGHRCDERKFVELDHVTEVARGGKPTVANLRLRCWAHNQLEAERTFGPEFMRHKHIAAAEARAGRQPRRGRPLAPGRPVCAPPPFV